MLDLFAPALGQARAAAPREKSEDPSILEKKSTNSTEGTPPPKIFEERAGNSDRVVDTSQIHFDPCKKIQAPSSTSKASSKTGGEGKARRGRPPKPKSALELESEVAKVPDKKVKRVSAMVKAPTMAELAEEGCIVEDADDPRRADKWRPTWQAREGHPSKRGWGANINAIHLIESKAQLPKPNIICWKGRRLANGRVPWDEAEPDILKFVAAGGTVAAYSQASGLSYITISKHLTTSPTFKAQLAEARQAGADALAAEALAIASSPMPTEERITVYDKNNEVVTRSVKLADNTYARKLAFQARMMLLEKWAPEKYGPNAKAEVSGGMAEKLRAARERIRSDLRASKRAAKTSDAS